MAVTMPDGKRFAVCLTFDFDGMSLFFGNDGTFSPQAISRGEFDARVGVPRLLGLLEERGIRSTWFVPGHSAETWPKIVRSIADGGHEVACHGYCHEAPTAGNYAQEERALLRGKEAIERLVGQSPVGYRAPRWDPSPNTVGLLLEHGFIYAANGMASDFHPYPGRIGDRATADQRFQYGRETSLIEIPSYWYLTDIVQLEHVLAYPNRIAVAPSETMSMWIDEFDFGYQHEPGGVITYVFHPMGMGRPHRFMMLMRLLDHIASRGDIWFATCEQIARAWTPDPPGLWAFDESGELQLAGTTESRDRGPGPR